MPKNNIRVRFAPSPTGPLHIGGVRTALYNYLLAKKNKGKFILRIEDTDKNRFVPGAEEYIIESFQWCGIKFDEGVGIGGPFGPYKQSERKDIYAGYAQRLIVSGNAYYCFDTPDQLESIRKQFESEKKTFVYNAIERNKLVNSLTLSYSEVQKKIADGTPYVVRFKMRENEQVKMNDLIRGKVEVSSNVLDDKILFKSDGMPTYHLANVVDDHLMEISHVIRGEEWLPSLPLHVLLYKAFGWNAPEFAHLPLLLKPEGNGKLSKRDGERLGFPVFPLRWKDPITGEISTGYREEGYFSDAFLNMLALLGWNPGDERELFSLEELTDAFSIEKVGKSGSKFDLEKAKWFNHQYLIRKSDEELAILFLPFLMEKNIKASLEFVIKVVALVKERAIFVKDFWEQSSFFFVAPEQYDDKTVQKRWKGKSYQQMIELSEFLNTISDFSAQNTEQKVKAWTEENSYNMGAIMNNFRLLVVGEPKGPHLFEIISLIGKQDTIIRLQKGIEKLGKSE
jgi:glutamyl-tRNA synthetase